MFCLPFRGLALQGQGGVAVLAEWVLADRRVPDA
jgi:hypothetical protein